MEQKELLTVIVADDETELREAVCSVIPWKEIGFRLVGSAGNGLDALQLVEQLQPDLLLTDIRMPYISGVSLAQQVRELRPLTQIAFLSGYDDFAYAQKAIEYNVISYLLKPISMRELTEEETERAARLFKDGRTEIKDFINALMFDYRELPYSEDFIPYINRRIGHSYIGFWDQNDSIKDFYDSFVDSFLYETTEYQDKGRLRKVADYYGDLSGVYFSVSAFIDGVENLTGLHINEKGWDPKSTQVLRLYYNKYLPLFETENDAFGKCVLAYRFFVSTLDYLGFRIAACERSEDSFISEELARAAKDMLDGKNYDEYRKAVSNELSRKK